MINQQIPLLQINQTNSSNHNANFDYSLEALRGLAAFLVVLEHAYKPETSLDPNYNLEGVWQIPMPGHLSVIVFFMLSGYVIGLANRKAITTNEERKLYLKKRLVRLYPLYALAIIATVLVASLHNAYIQLSSVGGWVFFLQGLAVEVPAFNQPLWSLSYEIIYYLLFLLVSYKQWRAEWVALFFLGTGLTIHALQLKPMVLASYSYGAVFWFLGLLMTRFKKSETPQKYGVMLAFLLLMLCFHRLNFGGIVLASLRLDVNEVQAPYFFDRAIVFSDISLLCYCVPLLLCFTNRFVFGKRFIELIAFSIPGLYLMAYIVSGKIKQPDLYNTVFFPSIFYLLSILAYVFSSNLESAGRLILDKLKPLGLISYGVYIIHVPILSIFSLVPVFTGTVLSFAIRLIIYLFIVLLVGWVLERKVQPWFKEKLM
ncbi:acyltransferase family protein [Hymenobacter latericus]|uniref:acyltransferase family protein n=1 Tax=Hymenobacter sp. YIM 151858-1 TaxID=2987688 RepID=UPI002226D32B|nr:acyltransferase [Hymenobacter sp. YIM 151858-1]UYZ60706.1 acyltransferase [Hymenobacter sp. YIM 151858-1]